MSQNAPRAAVYARYSSDLQNERSIEDQTSICRAYAASKGYIVVEIFADEAMSSMDWGRPGLHAMLQAAEAGRLDVIVAEMPDRISRDPEHLFAIFKRANHYDVQIDSPQDGVATKLSILLRSLTGAVFYGDLSARVAGRMREQAKQGRILGRAPYGYRDIPGQPGEKEIVEEQAVVVRRVFADYIAGVSPYEIARTLTREGVPPPGSVPWSRQHILHGSGGRSTKGILANPVYVGQALFGAYQQGRHPVSGRTIRRHTPEQAVTVPVPHLRIIDDATWEAAQATRRQRSTAQSCTPTPDGVPRPRKVVPRQRDLLSGLVVCGVCGSTMMRTSGGREPYGSRITCSRAFSYDDCNNKHSYALRKLEKAIVARLVEALSDEARMREGIAAYNRKRTEKVRRTQGEEKTIRKRLAEIDGALMRLVRLVSAGGRAADLVKGEMEVLDAERAGLEERLRLAEAEATVTTLRPAAVARYRRALETLQTDLREGRRPKTLMAFRSIIDSVILHPTERYRPMEFTLSGRIGPFLGMDTVPEGRSAEAIVSDKGYLAVPVYSKDSPATRVFAQRCRRSFVTSQNR